MVLLEYWKKEMVTPNTYTFWEKMIILAKIHTAINHKLIKQGEDPDIASLIKRKLPKYLTNLADFFSKKDSDTFPLPRKGTDIEIQLTEPFL